EVVIARRPRSEPLHMAVDSTGLKVFGEGEGKVRKHGYTKRRTWAASSTLGWTKRPRRCLAVLLTSAGVGDSQVLPELVEQAEGPIEQVSGDGAYDTRESYRAIVSYGARPVIPPRANAKPWSEQSGHPEAPARNAALAAITEGGEKQWKHDNGYHRRSLAETARLRIKTLFGPTLKARSFPSQVAEAYVRCAALNRRTGMGMPESHAMA
ncbi:MAG: IS5 family transposase, partial [Gammaproteobacteria bacterium]